MKFKTDGSTAIRKPAETSESKGFDWANAPPVVYTIKRLKQADLPASTRKNVWPIALAIADAMGPKGVSWPSKETISKWTGISRATITRHLKLICADGDLPLFTQTWPGETVGEDGVLHQHRSPRYTLIRSPLVFAELRDILRQKVARLEKLIAKPGPMDAQSKRTREDYLKAQGKIQAAGVRAGLDRKAIDRKIEALKRSTAKGMPDGD